MGIEALIYICFFVICLWLVSLYSKKSEAGRKRYSRSEMLSLSSQCNSTPKNWISIHEIKKIYHETRLNKFNDTKIRVKSLTKGNHLVLPIEDIENIQLTYHSSPITRSLYTSACQQNSLKEQVRSEVNSGDLYSAASILNEMNTQGLKVKRNLLDSFLILHNTKQISLSSMNPNVQEFVPEFSKLNPNAQEFRNYEFNPDAVDFTPSNIDI